jgi:SAM-dependent methyltransferase
VAQITWGVRRVLSAPAIYKTFQAMIGTAGSKTKLINEHIRVEDKHHVLDIGCGTGVLLDYLPSTINYVGFDSSKKYIDYAKKKYGDRGVFIHQEVDDRSLSQFEAFDRVVAIGILHHLDDQEATRLFTLAKKFLKPKIGQFHSIDPCFVVNQPVVSKFLIERDRGQNVRTPGEYESLAKNVFSNVRMSQRNDMLRIPYNHTILCCT